MRTGTTGGVNHTVEGDTKVIGVTIGRGKKPHLAILQPAPDSWYIDHVLCGRLGKDATRVEIDSLDDACANCVKTFEAGQGPGDGGNTFVLEVV